MVTIYTVPTVIDFMPLKHLTTVNTYFWVEERRISHQNYYPLEDSLTSFIFLRSLPRVSIILGISFSPHTRQICCRDKGYRKYFSLSAISFLQDMHFLSL